jgi:uncharacterized protein
MAWLVSEGHVLASAEVASSAVERTRGLLGRSGIDGAIVIEHCRWVHTIGMKFPIDVAYVDAAGTVLRIASLARFRVDAPCCKARWVIEGERGAFERWGLKSGMTVEVRE